LSFVTIFNIIYGYIPIYKCKDLIIFGMIAVTSNYIPQINF